MDRSNAWRRWGPLLAPFAAIILVTAACGGGGGGTPPTVTTTNPANAAVNVPLTADVSVTFSQAMDPAATEAAFSTAPATDCTFSWNAAGTVLTCEPTSDLTADTAYTVTIAATATNAGGAPLASAFGFGFTTGAAISGTCTFGTSLFGSCRFGP